MFSKYTIQSNSVVQLIFKTFVLKILPHTPSFILPYIGH